MQRGDLSNKAAPRHVVVFEGAVATLQSANRVDFDRAYKRKKYWEALASWDWNPMVLAQIVRMVRGTDVNIEVCTWIGADLEYQDFALAIDEELSRMNIPVRSVWSTTPDQLARDLAYLPDIAAIYDPDPDHVLRFGRRGVYLTHPSQIGRGNG